MAAIDKTQTLAESIQPASNPAWLYWANRAHFLYCAGSSLVTASRAERAVPLFTEAAQLFSNDYQRDQQNTLIWLAEALNRPGEQQDLEAAAHYGIEAIQITESLMSGGSAKRIRTLQQQMEPHDSLPAVREFVERARGMGTG